MLSHDSPIKSCNFLVNEFEESIEIRCNVAKSQLLAIRAIGD